MLAAAVAAILGGVTVVVVVSGRSSRARTEATPRPSAHPAASLAPQSLEASEVGPFSVTLSWTQSSGGGKATEYLISRDGSPLHVQSGTDTSYTDDSLTPGKSYTYDVQARSGALLSAETSLVVTAPIPSLASARVEGAYNVSVKPVSQFGFDNRMTRFTLGWRLTPTCNAGACTVVLTDLNVKAVRVKMRRKGATYSGTETAKLGDTCQKVPGVSTMTIEFHVVKAGPVTGTWRAVKLAGTLTQRDAAQLGCGSSEARSAITMNLVT